MKTGAKAKKTGVEATQTGIGAMKTGVKAMQTVVSTRKTVVLIVETKVSRSTWIPRRTVSVKACKEWKKGTQTSATVPQLSKEKPKRDIASGSHLFRLVYELWGVI